MNLSPWHRFRPSSIILRRGGGWNPDHGTWYYQLELPPRPDGSRRPPLRQGGFATKTAAETDLAAARDLLAIADRGDPGTAARIADALTTSVRQTRRLPDPARVRTAIAGETADQRRMRRFGTPHPQEAR
jgi:hypothetical protein